MEPFAQQPAGKPAAQQVEPLGQQAKFEPAAQQMESLWPQQGPVGQIRHIDWPEQQSACEPDEQQMELSGQQPPIPVAFRQQVEPLGQHPLGEPEQQE